MDDLAATPTPTDLDLALGTQEIPEAAAFSAFQSLQSNEPALDQPLDLDGNTGRQEARKTLKAYVDRSRAFNRPLFPEATARANKKRNEYTRRLFTEDLADVLDPEQHAALEQRAKHATNPEAYRSRQILKTYLNSAAGQTIPAGKFDFARDQFAAQLGLKDDTSDSAVFQEIRRRYQEHADTTAKLETVAGFIDDNVFSTNPAHNGGDFITRRINELVGDFPERLQNDARSELLNHYRKTRDLKRTTKPVADRIVRYIGQAMILRGDEAAAATDTDGVDLSQDPEILEDAVDQLLKLSPQEQQAAAMHIRATLENLPDQDGILKRSGEAIWRTTAGLSRDSIQFLRQLLFTGTAQAAGIQPEESGNFAEFDARFQARAQVLQSGGIAPLFQPSDGWGAKAVVGGSSQLPTFAAFFGGPAGIAALGTSMAGSSLQGQRLETPDAPVASQLASATVSGTAQAGLEFAMTKTGLRLLKGRAPTLSKLLSKNGIRNAYARSAIAFPALAAGAAATEYTEEIAQAATDRILADVTRELAGFDADTDWKGFFADWMPNSGTRQSEEVLAAVVPFALLGSGAVGSYSHFRQGQWLQQSKTALKAVGIPEARIEAIQSAEPAEAAKLTQEAFQEGLEEVQAEQRTKALEVLKEAATLYEEAGYPIVFPETNDFTEETSFIFQADPFDPSTRQAFATEEEALTAFQQAALDMESDALDAITDAARETILDTIAGEGTAAENSVDFIPLETAAPSITKAADVTDAFGNPVATPEQIRARVQEFLVQGGQRKDIPNLIIKAKRIARTLRNGTTRQIVQYFKDSDPIALMEDTAESLLDQGLTEGFLEAADIVQQLRQVEAATGNRYLAENYDPATGNRLPLLEGFSAFARDYVFTNLRSQQLPDELRAWVSASAVFTGQGFSYAKELARVPNVRKALDEGRIDAGFEAMVGDMLGMNPAEIDARLQAKYEAELAAEALEGFPEIGDAAKGKLPHPQTLRDAQHPLTGEVQRLYDGLKRPTRRKKKNGDPVENTRAANAYFLPYGEMVDLDTVRGSLNEDGFAFDSIQDMLDALDGSLNYQIPTHATATLEEDTTPSFSLGNAYMPATPFPTRKLDLVDVIQERATDEELDADRAQFVKDRDAWIAALPDDQPLAWRVDSRFYTLTPNITNENGEGWRVTGWDERGPFGHSERPTKREALEDMGNIAAADEFVDTIPTPSFSLGRSAIPNSDAFREWFADSKVVDSEGNPLRMYRGDNKGHKLGDTFKIVEQEEEGSGALYFTNDPEVASGYALGKPYVDGSEWTVEESFPEIKYQGRLVPYGTFERRARLDTAVANQIKDAILSTEEYPWMEGDDTAFRKGDDAPIGEATWRDYLQRSRGNPLKAAQELLIGGAIMPTQAWGPFLEYAGVVDRARYDDPWAARAVVTPVFLSIQNPLDATNAPESVLSKLRKELPAGDPTLYSLENKETVVLVSKEARQRLQSLGYDGIKDDGGKNTGTDGHTVFLAFDSNQVKSAIANQGTFSRYDDRITFALSPANLNRLEAAIAQKLTEGPAERADYYERVRNRLAGVLLRFNETAPPLNQTETERETQRIREALAEAKAIIQALPADARGRIALPTEQLIAAKTERGKVTILKQLIADADAALEAIVSKDYLEAIAKLIDLAKPDVNPHSKQARGRLTPKTQRAVAQILQVIDLDPATIEAELFGIDLKIEEIDTKLADPSTTQDDTKKLIAERIELELQRVRVDTFGALSKQSAAEIAHAFDSLQSLYRTGRLERNIIDDAQRQEREAMRREVVDALPPVDQTKWATTTGKEGLGELVNAWKLGHYSFHQFMESIFPKSTTARHFQSQARKAETGFRRAMIDSRQRWEDWARETFQLPRRGWHRKLNRILADLSVRKDTGIQIAEGVRFQSEKLTPEQAEAIIRGDMKVGWQDDLIAIASLRQALADFKIARAKDQSRAEFVRFQRLQSRGKETPFLASDLEILYLLQLAAQPQYLPALDRYGFTREVLDKLIHKIDPHALAIGDHLAAEYAAEYDRLNPVFQRLYGFDMPQIRNYAPGMFENMKAGNTRLDPDSGVDLAANAMAAGFTKNRTHHTARPRQENALSVYWSHIHATEYFIHWAELVRDMRAVFNHPTVRRAIQGNYGKDVAIDFSRWLEALELDGNFPEVMNRASAKLAANIALTTSAVGLAFNVGSVLKQSQAALNGLLQMSVTDSIKGIMAVARDPSAIRKAWNSEPIQQRILEGMNPEDRKLLQAAQAKPSNILDAYRIGRAPLAWGDAAATALYSAVAYSYHYEQAKKQKLSDAQAEEHALRIMDEVIKRTAQPATTQDKSLAELTATRWGHFIGYIFRSDPRQKLAISMKAWEDLAKGRIGKPEAIRKTLVGWMIYGMMNELMGDVWQAISRDEDDEDRWAPRDYLAAAIAGPLSGGGILGALAESAIRGAIGTDWYGGSTLAADVVRLTNNQGSKTLKTILDDTDNTMSEVLKAALSDARAYASALGAIEPRIGILAVSARTLRDASGIITNLTPTEADRQDAILRKYKQEQKDARAIRAEERAAEKGPAPRLTPQERQLKGLSSEHRANAIKEITAPMTPTERTDYLARLQDVGLLTPTVQAFLSSEN